jgi:hypothetical protein
MKLKKPVSFFFGASLFWLLMLSICIPTMEVQAHQISVFLGPSYESIKVKNESKTRLTLTSFLGQYEKSIVDKYYFSLGVSTQLDAASINVVSFGLYGSVRYYFKGLPDRREASSEGTLISLTYPTSYFIGIGAFNKEVQFEGLDRQTVGGLSLQFGGTRAYSKKFYINWLAGYSYQGERNRVSYSNIEAYFGLGFWL